MRNLRRLLMLGAFIAAPLFAQSGATDSDSAWRFAVSGDSRNCGDVVMPAIAQKVRADASKFYWHLGDYRAIADFDQDFRQTHPKAGILAYENDAWQDFIEQQLMPFGEVPVRLALGNHETISPKSRSEAIQQFADWWGAPELTAQRLKDDPKDHKLETYYHWIQGGVDFITLDNASDDQFDDAQLDWFSAEIARAAKDPDVRSVVVGMHAALPDSLTSGHSMNDSSQGTASGRAVYRKLAELRKQTGKNVYVLASHSHFVLEGAYDTACRIQRSEDVLPGWIVGTAGAVRYRLPKDLKGSGLAKTDVYGYLSGTVTPDGKIQFQFRQLTEEDVPEVTRRTYSNEFVHKCFQENSSTYVPDGPAVPPNCP